MNAGAARPVSTSTVVVTSANDRFGRGHSEYLLTHVPPAVGGVGAGVGHPKAASKVASPATLTPPLLPHKLSPNLPILLTTNHALTTRNPPLPPTNPPHPLLAPALPHLPLRPPHPAVRRHNPRLHRIQRLVPRRDVQDVCEKSLP